MACYEGPLVSPNIGPYGTHGSTGSPRRLRDFKPCDVCTPESCFVQMSAYPKTQKEFLLRPSCGVNWENKSSIARRISAEFQTMLKYLGKGDMIFLGIPLSTSTRRRGQD